MRLDICLKEKPQIITGELLGTIRLVARYIELGSETQEFNTGNLKAFVGKLMGMMKEK